MDLTLLAYANSVRRSFLEGWMYATTRPWLRFSLGIASLERKAGTRRTKSGAGGDQRTQEEVAFTLEGGRSHWHFLRAGFDLQFLAIGHPTPPYMSSIVSGVRSTIFRAVAGLGCLSI